MTDNLLTVHPYTGQTYLSFRLTQHLREWCADHSGEPEEDFDLMASFLRNLPLDDALPYMDRGWTRVRDDAQEWRDNLDASFLR